MGEIVTVKVGRPDNKQTSHCGFNYHIVHQFRGRRIMLLRNLL